MASKQAAIVLAVVALVAWFAASVRAGLARNGIGFDMGFLAQIAGFDISEGDVFTKEGIRHFVSSDSNAQALLAGLLNTIKVSVLAIGLTTVLGTLVGVGRISHNWLVRQLTFGFVELVRNTPMLIQLVFWYFAVVLKLPAISEASVWLGGLIASQQGIFVPGISISPGATALSIASVLLMVGFLIGTVSSHRYRLLFAAGAVAALTISIVCSLPLTATRPRPEGFTAVGGWTASPEFAALLIGLTVYTSSFIAEIVRGAIVSLPRGQWEAAAALGLSRRTAFKDIIVPQVFRVVLPAFGNQYISLAKSTSLGIAIGFPDLFNVYGTVANQSGRSLEGVIVVMLAYLMLSWIISGLVNAWNARLLRAGGSR